MARALLLLAALAAVAGHGHHHEGRHHAHAHGESHGHDAEGERHAGDGDLDHDHDHDLPVELSAADFEETVKKETHVWAIKFYSGMCGSCREFLPAWEGARELISGLHWATIAVDQPENAALAKRLGVLKEGIPNVKLVNAVAGEPTAVVSGDTPSAEALAERLRAALAKTGAQLDGAGFYRSARVEL